MECPICYEKILKNDEYKQNCCSQSFHGDCLLFWFLKKKESICPFCRSECDFELDKLKEKVYSKPVTRSRYKFFEKIFCSDVKTLLAQCEKSISKEKKTEIVINIFKLVFANPIILVSNSKFNEVVNNKIKELKIDNQKNRNDINKDLYYRATEILENVNVIYNTYLYYFK